MLDEAQVFLDHYVTRLHGRLCVSPHTSIKLLISNRVYFCTAPHHHGLQ